MIGKAKRLFEKRSDGKPIGNATDERCFCDKEKSTDKEIFRHLQVQIQRKEEDTESYAQRCVGMIPFLHKIHVLSAIVTRRKSPMPTSPPIAEPLMRII